MNKIYVHTINADAWKKNAIGWSLRIGTTKTRTGGIRYGANMNIVISCLHELWTYFIKQTTSKKQGSTHNNTFLND